MCQGEVTKQEKKRIERKKAAWPSRGIQQSTSDVNSVLERYLCCVVFALLGDFTRGGYHQTEKNSFKGPL